MRTFARSLGQQEEVNGILSLYSHPPAIYRRDLEDCIAADIDSGYLYDMSNRCLRNTIFNNSGM
jgi:hypothetical protein